MKRSPLKQTSILKAKIYFFRRNWKISKSWTKWRLCWDLSNHPYKLNLFFCMRKYFRFLNIKYMGFNFKIIFKQCFFFQFNPSTTTRHKNLKTCLLPSPLMKWKSLLHHETNSSIVDKQFFTRIMVSISGLMLQHRPQMVKRILWSDQWRRVVMWRKLWYDR